MKIELTLNAGKPGETYGLIPAGFTLKAVKPLSSNAGDNFLFVILCEAQARDGYATWIFNSQCNGAAEGHYFNGAADNGLNYSRALADFNSRG